MNKLKIRSINAPMMQGVCSRMTNVGSILVEAKDNIVFECALVIVSFDLQQMETNTIQLAPKIEHNEQ